MTKRITFSPAIHNFSSKSHMHLLIAGHKGDNHDSVNKMTLSELITLINGIMCLNKESKSLEPFSLHAVCDLMDQPERCKQNWVLSYTRNAKRRWIYFEFIDMNKLVLHSKCHTKTFVIIEDCKNDSRNNISMNNQCCFCANLDYDRKSMKKMIWRLIPKQNTFQVQKHHRIEMLIKRVFYPVKIMHDFHKGCNVLLSQFRCN